MSRILKRPMFRKGGPTPEGLISLVEPRRQYAASNYQDLYKQNLQKREILESPIVNQTVKDFENQYLNYLNSLDNVPLYGVEEFGPGTFGEMSTQFPKPTAYQVADTPAIKEAFIQDKLAEQKQAVEKAKTLGATQEEIPETAAQNETEQLNGEQTINENDGTQTTDQQDTSQASDLRTVYEDLLPLFEKELGLDGDETRRQKYMQLAQLGLGILAQPGGNLGSIIGKAGMKPLEDLSKIVQREKQEKTLPKRLALETALKRTEGTDIEQKINAIARISKLPKDVVAKSFVTTTAETSADAATDKLLREGAIERIGLGPAASINYTKKIKKLIETDPSLAGAFDKLVPEKPQEGEYYVTPKGDLTRYKDGKFLAPSDKGFKD